MNRNNKRQSMCAVAVSVACLCAALVFAGCGNAGVARSAERNEAPGAATSSPGPKTMGMGLLIAQADGRIYEGPSKESRAVAGYKAMDILPRAVERLDAAPWLRAYAEGDMVGVTPDYDGRVVWVESDNVVSEEMRLPLSTLKSRYINTLASRTHMKRRKDAVESDVAVFDFMAADMEKALAARFKSTERFARWKEDYALPEAERKSRGLLFKLLGLVRKK